MPNFLKRSIFCFLFLQLSITIIAQEYDIYLVIGQSNMAGRGELTKNDLLPMKGVWLLNEQNNVEIASNPMNKYSSIRKNINMQKNSIPKYNLSPLLLNIQIM